MAGTDGGEVPARQKFLLGDRLQATALDVLKRLVEATYTRDRRRHLVAANLGIEKLRFLCRLAKDLGHRHETSQPVAGPGFAQGRGVSGGDSAVCRVAAIANFASAIHDRWLASGVRSLGRLCENRFLYQGSEDMRDVMRAILEETRLSSNRCG